MPASKKKDNFRKTEFGKPIFEFQKIYLVFYFMLIGVHTHERLI